VLNWPHLHYAKFKTLQTLRTTLTHRSAPTGIQQPKTQGELRSPRVSISNQLNDFISSAAPPIARIVLFGIASKEETP
jgi:hypothetical protein